MSLYEAFRSYLDKEKPVALATIVGGPSGVGTKLIVHANGGVEGALDVPELLPLVASDASQLLHEGRADMLSYELPSGSFEVFVDVFPVAPQLVVIGATDTAIALSRFARTLGYRVVIADARAAFAIPERFPDADQVLKGWPQDVLPDLRLDENTYVVLLSHDPKFDEPTLQHVLPSEVRYIGAIGSRRTQQQRMERLRAEGYTEEQLARLHGPIGLDLGGRSPEETALAIMAEITAVRYGRNGGSMRRRLQETSAR